MTWLTPLPEEEYYAPKTTGISIGVSPESGVAPLKVKISAMLWKLNTTWTRLAGKLLVFNVDGVNVGSAYSSDRPASITTTLAEGIHEIHVRFDGDIDYDPSASDIVTVEVSAPPIEEKPKVNYAIAIGLPLAGLAIVGVAYAHKKGYI